MTEEQIKQNAEEYTKEVYDNKFEKAEGFWGGTYNSEDITDAFIEGAHSRDEEIKELNDMVDTYREEASHLYERCNNLFIENNQLRNPWISVKERLPERHTPVYAKNNTKAWFFALRTDNRQRPWYNIVGRYGEKVTHWKPIPEL